MARFLDERNGNLFAFVTKRTADLVIRWFSFQITGYGAEHLLGHWDSNNTGTHRKDIDNTTNRKHVRQEEPNEIKFQNNIV